jgi:hypothetical protein
VGLVCLTILHLEFTLQCASPWNLEALPRSVSYRVPVKPTVPYHCHNSPPINRLECENDRGLSHAHQSLIGPLRSRPGNIRQEDTSCSFGLRPQGPFPLHPLIKQELCLPLSDPRKGCENFRHRSQQDCSWAPSGAGSKQPRGSPEELTMSMSPQSLGVVTSPVTSPPHHPQTAFILRPARFRDLPAAARTCSLAFNDDVLFGRLIHPYRKSYPTDVDKYWYRRFAVDFWDWSHTFLVTTEPAGDGKAEETVTGFAHWSRIAPSLQENRRAGWGLAWWDPSKCSSSSCRP